MSLEFHKMHGAGNDFVVLDLREQQLDLQPTLAAQLADRRLGIGCDQILVVSNPADRRHAARYEIWNADGSRAGQCGNGARCIGLYLELHDRLPASEFSLESPAGTVRLRRHDDGQYEVEMGVPVFEPGRVPTTLVPENGWYSLELPGGPLTFGAASMGNPHATLPVDSLDDPDIPELGRLISTHEAFPEGCNAGFARIDGQDAIGLRVIERGTGETLACGSGACAAVAILRRQGLVGERVTVALPGGDLVIKWPGADQPIRMKGPAKYVFKGNLNG